MPAPELQTKAVYESVETRLFEGDLVQFRAVVARAGEEEGPVLAAAYAECAAAQYTLIRGYGFARHLRTNVYNEGGLWRADSVYTISPSLPRGLKTMDAEVVVSACRENRIPTV